MSYRCKLNETFNLDTLTKALRDVYNAGFLAGFLLGRSLKESALFATVVAAGSVKGYGRDCYPTEEDLKNFFH